MEENIDVEEKIGKYLYEKLKINKDTKYKIENIKAKELLSPNRIDLIAKYLYIKYKKENIKSDLAEKIYKEHIEIFSEGKFYEPGSETKKNYDAFISEFENLYEEILKNGFDCKKSLIPVGKDNSLLDGAHRVSTSIYLDKNVEIIKFLDMNGGAYNYEYFQKRQMNTCYLDFLALNYAKIKKGNIYVVCLWPVASKVGKISEVENLLKKYSNIVYKKKHCFTYEEMKNFLTQIYGNQEWIGKIDNNYSGIYEKLNLCYSNCDTIFYCIEGGTLDEILELKECIRKIYGIGKHAVHITDNYEESEQVLNLILNEESMNHLKYGVPLKYPEVLKKLEKMKNIQNENIIFNPEYTLSIYGIKEAKIYDNVEDNFINKDKLSFDISSDIRNFFYYNNMKFLTPIAASKIENVNNKEFLDIYKKRKESVLSKIKSSCLKKKYKIRTRIIRVLRKLGILDMIGKK